MPEGRTGPGRLQADQVQPFLIESSGIRGRLLRLEAVCDRILGRHDYPAPVARLLASQTPAATGGGQNSQSPSCSVGRSPCSLAKRSGDRPS